MEPQLSFWQVMLLALIQGVAEFLPISSSGHVCVLASWMGQNLDIATLNIVLHLGSLAAIVVFYFRRVLKLLTEDRRVIGHLIVGTIPAVLIVIAFRLVPKLLFEKDPLKDALESPLVAGLMLPVTGALLLWSQRITPGTGDYRTSSWLNAFLIGCAQAAAILPGLSRSGSTIVAGLGRGLSRESAATFSFLLAIPAILGAGVLELKDVIGAAKHTGPMTADPTHLAIGALVAFIVGLASLWVLVRLLERGKLTWFAYYCIAAGLLVLAWQGYTWSRSNQPEAKPVIASSSAENITVSGANRR
jgi:undecaprenyl-diphosphatase